MSSRYPPERLINFFYFILMVAICFEIVVTFIKMVNGQYYDVARDLSFFLMVAGFLNSLVSIYVYKYLKKNQTKYLWYPYIYSGIAFLEGLISVLVIYEDKSIDSSNENTSITAFASIQIGFFVLFTLSIIYTLLRITVEEETLTTSSTTKSKEKKQITGSSV